MELDPGVAAEDVGPADGVPRRYGKRDEREGGAQARREVAEHARAERHADHEVERDRRPRRELEDLEAVAERAASGGVAANPEPYELEDVAGQDRAVDRDPQRPLAPDERDRAQEQPRGVEPRGAPEPLPVGQDGKHGGR